MNRVASLAILPMMTLAIVFFARFADAGGSQAEPPREGELIVANLRDESLTFIDVKTGDQRNMILPGPPHEVVEAEGRLYVTLGRANAIAEVDRKAGAILRILKLEGEPHGIALYGQNLIVTLDKGNEAVVVDRATLTELRRYPTGNTPHVVGVSSDSIIVTDSRDGMLRQLEPEVRTVAAGSIPEGIAIVGGRVISADAGSGTLTFANAADLSGSMTATIGVAPVRVVAFGSERVLVALQGDGEVALVAVSGEVERRMKTAERPDGMCVSPGGDYFAVASNAGGLVEVFSTEDWKLVTRIPLAAGLGACAWQALR